MRLLLYLETVWGIKVQLIWEICHSSFIGDCCPGHHCTLGQLKEAVRARSVADVTCKIQNWLNYRLKCICKSLKVSAAFLLPAFALSSQLCTTIWVADTRRGVLKPTLWANEMRSCQNKEPPIPSPIGQKVKVTTRGYYESLLQGFCSFTLNFSWYNTTLFYPTGLRLPSCDQGRLCWRTCHWSTTHLPPVWKESVMRN